MPSPGRPEVARVAAFGHQADLGGQPNSPAFSGAEATLTASAISTDGTLRVKWAPELAAGGTPALRSDIAPTCCRHPDWLGGAVDHGLGGELGLRGE